MRFTAVFAIALVYGCTSSAGPVPLDSSGPDGGVARCAWEGMTFCDRGIAVRCTLESTLIVPVRTDCTLENKSCHEGACVTCRPDAVGCFEGNAARCRHDARGWEITETCDFEVGFACIGGVCARACERALEDRSYAGCEFFPVDLDSKGEHEPPFGIIVSNPNPFTTHVVLEVDDALPGEPANIRVIG